jgi:hypothetical protein
VLAGLKGMNVEETAVVCFSECSEIRRIHTNELVSRGPRFDTSTIRM